MKKEKEKEEEESVGVFINSFILLSEVLSYLFNYLRLSTILHEDVD